jgi:hypothetical protein
LREILAAVTSRAGRSDWYEIPTVVRNLYPDDVRAVIGYGSWYVDGLRKPTSFADTYLVVDDYTRFHENAFHAWMNRTLPPNVYFIWAHGETHREIQGKYNVISAADLEDECSPGLQDVYNAGRMTKLVWIAWVRDDATRDWILERLIDAHRTLTPIALGLLPAQFRRDDFSVELLGLSYRGEPRLEGWERVRALHAADAERYRELHETLLAGFMQSTALLEAVPGGFRKSPSPQWRHLTRLTSRLLRRSRRRGYLRWPRVVLTEPHLVDLAVSEAERKAGVRIRVTPELRRHPFVFGLPEFLRVLRERNTLERIGRIRRRESRSAARPGEHDEPKSS